MCAGCEVSTQKAYLGRVFTVQVQESPQCSVEIASYQWRLSTQILTQEMWIIFITPPPGALVKAAYGGAHAFC